MRISLSLVLCGVAAALVAAPIPKETKVDPGDPDKFPDLKSPGWKKQEIGLQVWDVKEGTGDEVKAGATVTVKYTGWLTNGKLFDSSKERDGGKISFPLKQVIQGWQEGVPGMKVGGIRRLRIPPEMAYGERGAGKVIPANSELIFVIEVTETK